MFVVSGRTAVYRTDILQDPTFLRGFTDEKFFFGKFGPRVRKRPRRRLSLQGVEMRMKKSGL